MSPHRTSPTLSCLAVLTLAVGLAGCTGDPGRVDPRTSTRADGAPQDSSLLSGYDEPLPTGPGDGDADFSSGSGAPLADAPEAPAEAYGSDATTRSGAGEGPGDPGFTDGVGQGPLRAGYVDDNADFAAYERYVEDYRGPARDLSLSGRHLVTVTDDDGMPLLGARVTVGDVTVPTHVDGRALFFDVDPGDRVEVAYGEAQASADLDAKGASVVALDTQRVAPGDLVLDLDLVLDTTGSMGDEIARLNTSLDAIATRLDELPSRPEVRYALTVYRDQGDAYVFRAHDFTDLETFAKELARTAADGGGDTPEALDEAFHAAVNGPAWGQDTASVELMLLVSDAPSHLGDDDAAPAYAADVQAARERGIEVVPLAASGSDDSAEFQFRQLAQQTLGTFFFLTYGADGSPGDETTHHVEDYSTGSLEDQVVDHVSARLATYTVAVGSQPDASPTDAPTGEPTDQSTEQAPTPPR